MLSIATLSTITARLKDCEFAEGDTCQFNLVRVVSIILPRSSDPLWLRLDAHMLRSDT